MTEAKPERKKRAKTELPTTVEINGSEVELSEQSLPVLASIQNDLKNALANVPFDELRLRAVNAEIRKRAK